MIELYELAGADPELRFSPFCWRIRMALAHKGLEARTHPWHFQEPGLPGNATRVPVLVDDGEVFADSTPIALHLEERYSHGPSLFGGETGEAHCRFIMAWTDIVLHAALFPVLAPDILRHVRPEAEAYFRRTRERRLGATVEEIAARRPAFLEAARQAMAPLRHTLAGQDFLGGNEPSYADYTVFGAFQWARCVSPDDILTSDDPLQAWREAMLGLFDGLAEQAVTVTV